MAAMGNQEDPFVPIAAEPRAVDDFAQLSLRQVATRSAGAVATATVGLLYGFDALERPLLSNLPPHAGQVLPARTTVALRFDMVGAEVLVVFADGDSMRPIITGVLQAPMLAKLPDALAAQGVSVQADDTRHVITAEREIVLRCGDASITLTRAGKVIIQGSYILSRSSGYNKIKGAAIDLN